jgi:hypothetical protein
VDARARGALFRGLGQEPGWHLEIHPERIVMVYQYGERRVVVPNPGMIVAAGQAFPGSGAGRPRPRHTNCRSSSRTAPAPTS